MPALLTYLTSLSRSTKRLIQLTADALLIALCFLAAMWLRLESPGFLSDLRVWAVPAVVFPLTVVIFMRLGLYRAIIRFISGQALVAILIGVATSAILMSLSATLLDAPIPRSVPGIYAALLFISVGGMRFIMRAMFRRQVLQNRTPVLIYGAGEAGRQLANALTHGVEYEPVGFLDDDTTLQQSTVAGKKVYSARRARQVIEAHGVKTILMAIPSVSRARRREIVASLEPLGLAVKTIPGIADIVDGRADFSDLRTVKPEDLLGRDPVPPRDALMSRNIRGKVVLVTGAGGSIGSELCRQIIGQDPAALILLEVSEFALYSIHLELKEALASEGKTLRIEPVLGSVQNPGRVRTILRVFEVQTVYHAAAYKHVVLVEENVVEGVRNNVFGTRVIAEAAAEQGVENFIMISTDKAVRPTNFMGASKRMAELICQAQAMQDSRTTFSMVRFGNVLGSSGSVIPRFRAQIAAGGPVTVTHREITRFFMTIPEAAQLVIQAGAMAKGGDVFVLDMGKPVKIIDLAQTMVRLHGLKPYVLDENGDAESEPGDIAIQIVGLNKGEKLYEELLIGDNPQGTEHPRVMTATEVSLTREEIDVYLDRLFVACQAFDIPTIRDLFIEAPLAFRPSGDAIHDLMWNAARTHEAEKSKSNLRLINRA